MKIYYIPIFVRNLIEIESFEGSTCIALCCDYAKNFVRNFLRHRTSVGHCIVHNGFVSMENCTRRNRRRKTIYRDELRVTLQPWKNTHPRFGFIFVAVEIRWATADSAKPVNLSVGRPIPVDIPDFINSSFAGLHSAY